MWTEETYPDDFTKKEVVSIYKKGNPELRQNFKPICLLSSSYRIPAKVLKARIAEATNQFICNTQFGFWKGRSTSEPRILPYARPFRSWPTKYNTNPLRLGKSFRSSQPRNKKIEALERMKLDRKMMSNIKDKSALSQPES